MTGNQPVRAALPPRKERPGQRRIVPAHAPSSILHHIYRSVGGREGIIEELALTGRHVGPSIEKRASFNDDSCPWALFADDARARGGTRIRVLREGAKRGGDCHHKNHDRQDAGIAGATHRRFSPVYGASWLPRKD